MTDEQYHEPFMVDLYDMFNPWDVDHDFYMAVVGSRRRSVLDLGCGTGLLATAFADAGHTVVGVDPSEQMLRIARGRHTDTSCDQAPVEWIRGDACTVRLGRRFDRIICTGHVFQVFLTEADQFAFFETTAAHLAPDGLLIFETRNPAFEAWRSWTPAESFGRVTHPVHGTVESFHDAEQALSDGILTFTSTCRFIDRNEEYHSTSRLRFSDRDDVEQLMARAGLKPDAVYGDWDKSPFTPESKEIIVIARLAS